MSRRYVVCHIKACIWAVYTKSVTLEQESDLEAGIPKINFMETILCLTEKFETNALVRLNEP